MITVPIFKGQICEQTKNAAIKQIAEDTKNIFYRHVQNVRKNLLQNDCQIKVQIDSFKQQFRQQQYAAIARQGSKQQEQKIWKDSEEYNYFTQFQRLFAQNQEQKFFSQQMNVETQKQAPKCSEVLQTSSLLKETMIKQGEKKDQSKLEAQKKDLQQLQFPAIQQKKPQKTIFFRNGLQKNMSSSSPKTNNAFIFPQPSQILLGIKSQNMLFNSNLNKNEKEAKSNIFTSQSNPKNVQIFGSHISSRQISNASSGIMELQGIFDNIKLQNDEDKFNSSQQFSSEPKKNGPSLFNQK